MPIAFTEQLPAFAAEVGGVDLTRLDDAEFAAIQAGIDRFGVLIFRDQRLDDAAQLAFSARFGALENALKRDVYGPEGHPKVTRLSNLDEAGERLPQDHERVVYNEGNEHWHTDSSFKPVPAKYSLLSARVIPPTGGETEFADARAAYDDWPGAEGVSRADLDGLICEHSIVYSRGVITGDVFKPDEKNALPPVQHRLVRTHPGSGRLNFYVGSHASHIVQWPVERGRALIKALNAWSTQPRYVYRHVWREGDLVMWDNRCVLHRGRPFDRERHRRLMHRTTVAGDGPTLELG
ncbi:MAG TPA: TauD/TfdA family dioxygenase [bacterium]|nr:TauD/TfdA family dioxygenase [bacterium]